MAYPVNASMSIYNEDFEKVELFFSCRSLKVNGISSCVKLYRILESGQTHLVGSTEVLKNNQNPDFHETFEIDFVFEKEQKFKVEAWHIKDESTGSGYPVGQAIFTLGDIVGSQYNMKILRIENNGNDAGKCIVRIDQQNDEKKFEINMDFQVLNVPKAGFFASLNTFVKIFKRRLTKAQKLNREERDLNYEDIPASEWLLVHKTENIKDTANPDFKKIKMKGSKLSDNDFNLPLKFEIMKYKMNGSHYVIGKTFCNLNDLVVPGKTLGVRMLKPKNGEMSLAFKMFNQNQVFQFVDYLEGGLNITQLVGIDFTLSNRVPSDPRSLHFINPPSLNQYQKCILSVGEILEKYNHTGLIPCYGFGAKLPGHQKAVHIFPLTKDISQPCFRSFRDLFNGYQNIVNEITFSGPTHFAPLLREINAYAKRNYEINPFNYSIYLLLTDGIIQDMPETIDCIVEGSFLPLSIIIIGIGDANFDNMVVLDGDDYGLTDSNGRVWMRDIVQFVPFKDFQGDAIMLREQVLEEIPEQVTSFYQNIKLKPQPKKFHLSQHNLSSGDLDDKGVFLRQNSYEYNLKN
jgi:hypothetical protein